MSAHPRRPHNGPRPGVVVTGMGVVSPLGRGSDRLLERWARSELGIEDRVARCREFDPAEHFSARELRRSDRFTQMAVVTSDDAIEQAGVMDALPELGPRAGCVIGTSFGGLISTEAQHDIFRQRGADRVSPLAMPLAMHNAAPASIAIRRGIHGPTRSLGTACAAGADAIGTAMRMLQSGDVDVMVAGGAEAALTDFGIAAALVSGAASPSGISRPFDARRDGFVPGEGAGSLVLERADFAAARGAEPLAELIGFAATTDAHHLSAPEPTGCAAGAAIAGALADAGVAPAEVDYVNAHGTSTPLNDRSETQALKRVFGDSIYRIPVSSTKSVIGHLVGAGGAVEAAATIEALRRRVAPPTVGYAERDPDLDLNYVPGGPQPLGDPDDGAELVAISNSFGFGGHNAVLCIRTAQAAPARIA